MIPGNDAGNQGLWTAQRSGQRAARRQASCPLSHPYLADTAGVIEAVTDGVVVLFPAGALGRQQHVH